MDSWSTFNRPNLLSRACSFKKPTTWLPLMAFLNFKMKYTTTLPQLELQDLPSSQSYSLRSPQHILGNSVATCNLSLQFAFMTAFPRNSCSEGVFGHVAGVVLGSVNGVVRGTTRTNTLTVAFPKTFFAKHVYHPASLSAALLKSKSRLFVMLSPLVVFPRYQEIAAGGFPITSRQGIDLSPATSTSIVLLKTGADGL